MANIDGIASCAISFRTAGPQTMTASPDWNVVTDADLVRGAAAGDRAAFGGIYSRYSDRLYDFCISMVRNGDVAADCVQEVFCTAANRLPQLRDPDKLRPWLYSIARNEALRCIRERQRERASNDLPDNASQDPAAENSPTPSGSVTPARRKWSSGCATTSSGPLAPFLWRGACAATRGPAEN
jgi:hypothetical protein